MAACLVAALACLAVPAVAQAGVEAGAQTARSAAGPIIVDVKAVPSTGRAPLLVRFETSIDGRTDVPGKWQWNFGDNGASNLPAGQSGLAEPAHIYVKPGNFLARVTFTDTDGRIGPKGRSYAGSAYVDVLPDNAQVTLLAEPPVAVLPDNGGSVSVTYECTVQNPPAGEPRTIWSYSLSVYNEQGKRVFVEVKDAIATSMDFSVEFSEQGTYYAHLVVIPYGNGPEVGSAMTVNTVVGGKSPEPTASPKPAPTPAKTPTPTATP